MALWKATEEFKGGEHMKVTDRIDHERTFRCTCCGWEGTDSEFTSEDEEGNDLCPACGGTEFEEMED